MDIKEKAKGQLEKRVLDIENFIAKKGVGSSYLNKAHRIQRNVNLAIAAGAILTIAGVTIWSLWTRHEDA
ncbi:hypothetical protein [Marinigracilibium pacificum]|uniref:Uncharacterized protein n=1 Tax=Marinigracilibium pacificum TaxID=2729599 RepID=A0A848IVP3_9BACT|nr:hypothetical protein [Marinigracilibium pacificum]NMM48553.1 hypothetical protein [Marinigracilibium pacificum]